VDSEGERQDDEARLVQADDNPAATERDHQDAGAKNANRGQDKCRGNEETHDGRGWALHGVFTTALVVAHEPVAGGPELEQHRGDEEHPDEHVHRKEPPKEEERDALDSEKRYEEDGGRAG
jgi:hypothetical protein